MQNKQLNNLNSFFSDSIILWYKENKRDLPWRNSSDPYKIWLSEVILQQTRVAQGMEYYLKFIQNFPTVVDLAKADESEVLKLWQGLGYYSRARNLHSAAKTIASIYKGVFPREYKDILSLKGVGEYTAAAIASFAFNEPYAVVDGNVYRLLARYFGIHSPIDSTQGKKEFAELANTLIDSKQAGTYNQAIMEFGSMQCKPVQPDCQCCPLISKCVAFQQNTINILPIKEKKTKVRNRYFNYFFLIYKGNTYLQKREAKDIWQNLYEFPLIEKNHTLEFSELIKTDEYLELFADIKEINLLETSTNNKHILSHQHIFSTLYIAEISNENAFIKKLTKTPLTQFSDYPISRLTERFEKKFIKYFTICFDY